MTAQPKTLTMEQAHTLGAQLAHAGRHKDAVSLFRGILIHDRDNAEAIQRLGSSLFEQGEYFEALYHFWRGLKLSKHSPIALTNYGLTLSQLGHPEEGLPFLERAAASAEKQNAEESIKALVYNNLGNTLERLDHPVAALAALDKGIEYAPQDAFPHYNRGIALSRLGRHEESIAALDRSLALRGPVIDSASRLNEADAYYNRGCAKLILGDLQGGFADYEHRLLTSSTTATPNLGLPIEKKWKGQSLAGKTILVHAEQGVGDTIQFLRFVPRLIERGAKVKLVVHGVLRTLCDKYETLPTGEPIDHKGYDYWVALMSLPRWLGLHYEAEIPAPWQPPVHPERIERWRTVLGSLPNRRLRPVCPKVAVCWAGNFRHKNDAHRSIRLDTFAELFTAPVEFVSVQQMREEDTERFAALKEIYPNITALWLDDFRDTAAVLLNCDLVITVDTAVAHLAGSLALPTWLLLPAQRTDWRWQCERTDSPWYPSVRLVRQQWPHTWPAVIAHTRADLCDRR